MLRKFVTLMVVPPGGRRVREFRIAEWAIWSGTLLLTGVVGVMSVCTYGYFYKTEQELLLQRERRKNAELWQAVNETTLMAERLEDAMSHLALDGQRLRDWHEMEPLSQDLHLMGMGGAEDRPVETSELELLSVPYRQRFLIEKLSNDLARLRLETQLQERSFALIREKFLASSDSLRHIPTILPIRHNQAWISSPFGPRKDPFTGRQARHLGVDFAGRKGTSINTTADGVVVLAQRVPDRRLGRTVVVEHDIFGVDEGGVHYQKEGIYRTEYGHLETVLVEEGQRVRRGQKIATMGNSGRSTGPHLHYAVRYQDRHRGGIRGYLNPKDFILDVQRGDVPGWLVMED